MSARMARIEALAGLIDFLDLLDGDPDLEAEEDGGMAGDDDLAPRLRPMGYPGDNPGSCDDMEDGGEQARFFRIS